MNRNSPKFQELQRTFKKKLEIEKKKIKRKMLDDLKDPKDGRWYSKLKRMCHFDLAGVEYPLVDEISHLSDQDQAKQIADRFSQISQEYEHNDRAQIHFQPVPPEMIPQFRPSQVKYHL